MKRHDQRHRTRQRDQAALAEVCVHEIEASQVMLCPQSPPSRRVAQRIGPAPKREDLDLHPGRAQLIDLLDEKRHVVRALRDGHSLVTIKIFNVDALTAAADPDRCLPPPHRELDRPEHQHRATQPEHERRRRQPHRRVPHVEQRPGHAGQPMPFSGAGSSAPPAAPGHPRQHEDGDNAEGAVLCEQPGVLGVRGRRPEGDGMGCRRTDPVRPPAADFRGRRSSRPS